MIWPSGNHTVYIRSASSDPHMAAKIPQAIVDEFTVVFSKLKASAAQAATFYQDQVTSGKSDYDNATLALSAYVRTHPTLANIQIGNQSIATISDPDFGPLLLQQRTAETQYDSMLAKLSASQIAATSADSTTSYYYVVDPPKVADYKTLPGKKALLVKPVSAAVVGVMVAGALLLLTWRMDRKAHSHRFLLPWQQLDRHHVARRQGAAPRPLAGILREIRRGTYRRRKPAKH